MPTTTARPAYPVNVEEKIAVRFDRSPESVEHFLSFLALDAERFSVATAKHIDAFAVRANAEIAGADYAFRVSQWVASPSPYSATKVPTCRL
jgi:hypothetical protein